MIHDQRQQGRRVILAGIRKAGKIARVDLAQVTGLSQATVTSITAELLQAGLIEENRSIAPTGSRRGRPRVALQIRSAAHLVAGVKVADRMISVAIMDFLGQPVAEANMPLVTQVLTGPELSRAIAGVIDRAAASAGLDRSDVSALGIGLAGVVDAQRGLVHWSPALAQRNTPLRDHLRDLMGIPAFIDNDANLVAMAELYFGKGKGVDDFLVVTVEVGIGLGIVLGGEIYRGTRGCGAEFGHTKVEMDGAKCRCGQRGCLEAYVADYALLRDAGLETGDPKQDLTDFLAKAGSGDAEAAKILSRARRYFTMGLANLVNIFDPQLIILAGEARHLTYLYDEAVTASVASQIVQIDVAPPEVSVHRWTDLMWARGAAAYAIENLAEQTLVKLGENAA